MITTRQARPDDAPACGEILQEWIDATDWFQTPHPDSAAQPMLRKAIESAGFTLAICAGDVAGFSCISGGFLEFLYVRGEYQNQGVGRMLLNRCKFACPAGFALWTFQQNTGARRFYQREGFLEVERTDGAGNEEGLPDIRYVWEGKA